MTQGTSAGSCHRLTLDGRNRLNVWGATEVVGFDDTAVILTTDQGTLEIHGRDLVLKALTPDGGQVAVEGTITALIYQEPKQQGGFFRRLFP